MNKANEIFFWDEIKAKLKIQYPQLTNSDLSWRHSSQEDLLEMIANKLGKTYKELQLELETTL
jgi:hypothetical protein